MGPVETAHTLLSQNHAADVHSRPPPARIQVHTEFRVSRSTLESQRTSLFQA